MSDPLESLPEKERLERQQVLKEALDWTLTPFRHGARIKGVGAECGSFIIDVFSAAIGIAPDYKLPPHALQWHLHKDSPTFDADMYTREIKRFGKEIPGPPLPADVVIFWWGHAYSHGAIVIEWPMKLIHCFPAGRGKSGVQFVDASRDPFLRRYRSLHPPKFYTAWGTKE